jgi:hypothetical protein
MSTRQHENPPTGEALFSSIHPIGNASVSYVGEPPNAFSIDSFIKELRSALAQDPVVDGFKHAAEPILERAFAREPEKLAYWFEGLIMERPDADLLRLLARFKPYTPQWRQQIVRAALGSSSPDVRDAAMQAVESWAEPQLVDLLRSHTETARWLAEYAAQVVRDLAE